VAVKPATTLPVHRLDLETYDQMVASGALEGQHVELLEGLIVDMSPQSPRHSAALEVLVRHFRHTESWLRVQLPLAIPPDSEPEPDLALVAERPPADRHPRTALLVIEVAVSSHAIDRGAKSQLYARAGVPVYWLIDVPRRVIEVRTHPRPDGYEDCETYREGACVPAPVDDVEALDVAALLQGIGG
jgi:Uma2 family endonuclease